MKTTVLPLKLKSLNKSKPGLGAVVKNLEKVVEQLTTRSCNLIFNIRNYAVEKWFLWTSLDEIAPFVGVSGMVKWCEMATFSFQLECEPWGMRAPYKLTLICGAFGWCFVGQAVEKALILASGKKSLNCTSMFITFHPHIWSPVRCEFPKVAGCGWFGMCSPSLLGIQTHVFHCCQKCKSKHLKGRDFFLDIQIPCCQGSLAETCGGISAVGIHPPPNGPCLASHVNRYDLPTIISAMDCPNADTVSNLVTQPLDIKGIQGI